MGALTASPITPVISAAVDPGGGASHDHGAAEYLLNAVAAGTGPSNVLALVARASHPIYPNIGWQIIAGDGGSNTFSALTVNLEGSFDNTNWFQLDQSVNAAGESRFVASHPVRYVRANVKTATVNAGAPTITVIFCA